MIKSYNLEKWTVSYIQGEDAAKDLFNAFLEGKIPENAVTVLSNGTTGMVRKIEFRGKTYVLKHDLRKKHRFEFLVQSFFVGSNATRLLRKLDKAETALSEGDGAARVLLSADKICCRCVLECFVLMEYVQGREIRQIPEGRERYGSRCAEIVRKLHANDLVHGDVHLGNFMLEDDSGLVRVIDISGKRATAYQRAFDKIRVEEYFGIRLDKEPGFWEKLVRAHLRYRARQKAKKQETKNKKPMNILILSAETVKVGKGGVDSVAAVLTDGFGKSGHRVVHLAWSKTAETASVSEMFYFPKRKPLDGEENSRFYENFLREHEIDAVIYQWGIGKEYPLSEVTRRLEIPVVAIFHNSPDYYSFRYQNRPLWWLKKYHRIYRQKKKYRWNLEHCDAIVLLAEGFRDRLNRCLRREQRNSPKICVIGNPTRYSAQNVDLSSKKKEVLYVGLDFEQKRPDLMLKTWLKVQDKFPDWTLRMLGGGKHLETVKQIASSLPLKNVSFEGWQDPRPYYCDASVFCMTSAFEGFPMVLGESARFACVPIVFDAIDAARDVIKNNENGILVPEGDIEKFAEELSRLMSDSTLRERLARNAEKDVNRFSAENVCARYLELFTEVGART